MAFLTPKRYEEQPCPSSESAGSRIISNGNFEGFIYGEQVKFLGIKAKGRGHPEAIPAFPCPPQSSKISRQNISLKFVSGFAG